MEKIIEPQLKSIRKYLELQESESFVIPEYQREYSWDLTACRKLWEDIESFIASDAKDPYFFGTIIVDCSERNIFHLIDGQQRTTTFLLLLKALLLHLNKAFESSAQDADSEGLREGIKDRRNDVMGILYKVTSENRPKMLEDFKKAEGRVTLEERSRILKVRSINEQYPEEVKNILESPSFEGAEKNVSKLPNRRLDNKYTNHFKNFKFFYDKLNELSHSKLNQFARMLLEKCQVIEIRSWQTEQAITMFNSLNSSGVPLSDANIIAAKIYSNCLKDDGKKNKFQKDWKDILEQAEKLNQRKIADIDSILMQYMYILRAKDAADARDTTVPGVRRYYTDINGELLKKPDELCKGLRDIEDKWEKVSAYPVIKVLLKFNANVKFFIASYLYRYNIDAIDAEKTSKIFECFLKLFAIHELVDANYSSKYFKSFLFSESRGFVDEKSSIDAIAGRFDKHIAEHWKKDDLVDIIVNDYDKNSLVYLNEYLYAKDFDIKGSVDIEHILPSSGRNIDAIKRDAGFDPSKAESDAEFQRVVNKLGNKILLETKINRAIGNDWFRSKIRGSIKEGTGYKGSEFPIAKALSLSNCEKWDKGTIEKATEEAANRIADFIFSGSKSARKTS